MPSGHSALALSGMIQAVGISANLDAFHEAFRRVIANDLNSLLMVHTAGEQHPAGALRRDARDGEEVRGGATQPGVTAIVMVPAVSRGRRLQVWTSMEFVKVKSGKVLGEKRASREADDVQAIADRYWNEPNDETKDCIERAWQQVLSGNWERFAAVLAPATCQPEVQSPRQLLARHRRVTSRVLFRRSDRRSAGASRTRVFPAQQAFLLDDGKNSTTVQLVRGIGLNSDQLCAYLKAHPVAPAGAAPSEPVTIWALKTTVSDQATDATFEFLRSRPGNSILPTQPCM